MVVGFLLSTSSASEVARRIPAFCTFDTRDECDHALENAVVVPMDSQGTYPRPIIVFCSPRAAANGPELWAACDVNRDGMPAAGSSSPATPADFIAFSSTCQPR